ncbi:hypothetical protein P9112_012519 [Eukaryota sp. TZLM1-RC]
MRRYLLYIPIGVLLILVIVVVLVYVRDNDIPLHRRFSGEFVTLGLSTIFSIDRDRQLLHYDENNVLTSYCYKDQLFSAYYCSHPSSFNCSTLINTLLPEIPSSAEPSGKRTFSSLLFLRRKCSVLKVDLESWCTFKGFVRQWCVGSVCIDFHKLKALDKDDDAFSFNCT